MRLILSLLSNGGALLSIYANFWRTCLLFTNDVFFFFFLKGTEAEMEVFGLWVSCINFYFMMCADFSICKVYRKVKQVNTVGAS